MAAGMGLVLCALACTATALDKFVNGIDDIKIGIKAYSRSGN